MGRLLTLFKARFHLLTSPPTPTHLLPPVYPPPNHYISVPLLILTTKRHPPSHACTEFQLEIPTRIILKYSL